MKNPEVEKACNAMKAIGISSGRVKPVLNKLLKLYAKHWEFIQADNYRLLVEAILDNKEEQDHQRVRVKRKEPMRINVSEPPQKKLHKVPEEDVASSTIGSGSGEISVIRKPDDIAAIHCSAMHKGKGPLSSAMISTTEKITSTIGSTSSCSKFPIHESASHLIPYRGSTSKLHPVLPDLVEGSSMRVVSAKSSQCMDHENTVESALACSSENKLDIVSLSSGNVKLCCIFTLGNVISHSPDMDFVLKLVEEEFLRSRKIVGPPFSLKSLLEDICIRSYELSNDCTNNSLISTSSEVISREQSVTIKSVETSEVHENDVKRHAQVYIDDITKGKENVKISLVDQHCSQQLPTFFYISRNIIYQKAIVNISLARISDEDCCPGCSGDCLSSQVPCACARVTNGEFAYTNDGLLKSDFLSACCSQNRFIYCQDCPIERANNKRKPAKCSGHSVKKFIKECWSKCGCSMQCGNRVVQRGITRSLQVFRTSEGKGWGIRTLEDLPRGAFLFEYVGEVVTNNELDERNKRSRGNERHTYPIQLDADWGSERILNDDFALCLDATTYGNVARFINHKCWEANLIEIPVEVETADHHYYHLAFFTKIEVKAYEELTWDYGIDFEDEHHPIKAFQCLCGSVLCRDNTKKGVRSKPRPSVSNR